MRPPPPMFASMIRVGRARQHIEKLKQELQHHANEQGTKWRVETADNDATQEVVLTSDPDFDPTPPVLASVLAGEALYNLRAALDYTVYTFAAFHHATGEPEGTQFVIVDNHDDFKSQVGRGRLNHVPDDIVRIIEGLQPYPDRQDNLWLRKLRELSNPDKHRSLTSFDSEGEAVAELNEAESAATTHTYTVQVGIEAFFRDGSPVVETLEDFANRIESLTAFFNRCFERRDDPA